MSDLDKIAAEVITNSPWGTVQTATELAEGIWNVTTASHGGIFLFKERRDQMPQQYREFAAKWSKGWGDQWYEEDLAAVAVCVIFPTELGISTENRIQAVKMLDSYVNVD